jgi:rare lipoprotein A
MIAVAWAKQLQLLLDVGPTLEDAQRSVYGLVETPDQFRGTASWYGPYFHGRQTATGETFNQHDLTAAHKTLPFGTYLKVRNLLNDRTVVVRINDRGPYVGERSLDLSYAAAQCLNSETVGVIPYEATILEPHSPALTVTALLTAQR